MVAGSTTQDGALDGMKEITAYMRRSDRTILDLIKNQGFPAVKIGGQWSSSRDKIKAWREKMLDCPQTEAKA